MNRVKEYVKKNQEKIVVVSSGVAVAGLSFYCIHLMHKNNQTETSMTLLADAIRRGETFTIQDDRIYAVPAK